MAERSDYSSYILPVGGLLVAVALLQRFGLLPSAGSLQADKNVKELENVQADNNAFNRNYIKLMSAALRSTAGGNSKVAVQYLKAANATALAKKLHKAKGTFNDNEDSVWSAFRNLKYKSQVTQLSDVFYNLYKIDLYTYLESFLNTAELNKLYNIIAEMKPGITIVS